MGTSVLPYHFELGIEVTEKKKTFTALLLVPIILAVMITVACSWTNVLADGEKVISYIPLAVGIALPLVCIDVPLCPAATAAAALINTIQAKVLQLFQQWQVASVAAAPGILSQLQVAIGQLEQQYQGLLTAFKVGNTTISSEVGAILSAVLAAINQIATLTGSVLKAGGTPAAAKKMLTVKIASGTVTFNSANLYTSKRCKNDVYAAVNVKNTGDPQLDTLNANLAKQVKSW